VVGVAQAANAIPPNLPVAGLTFTNVFVQCFGRVAVRDDTIAENPC